MSYPARFKIGVTGFETPMASFWECERAVTSGLLRPEATASEGVASDARKEQVARFLDLIRENNPMLKTAN